MTNTPAVTSKHICPIDKGFCRPLHLLPLVKGKEKIDPVNMILFFLERIPGETQKRFYQAEPWMKRELTIIVQAEPRITSCLPKEAQRPPPQQQCHLHPQGHPLPPSTARGAVLLAIIFS